MTWPVLVWPEMLSLHDLVEALAAERAEIAKMKREQLASEIAGLSRAQWQGSRGTKCPACRGSVCSEREEERVCELCGHRFTV